MSVNGPPVSLVQAAQVFSVAPVLSMVRAAAGLTPAGGLLELAGKSASTHSIVVDNFAVVGESGIGYSRIFGGSLTPKEALGFLVRDLTARESGLILNVLGLAEYGKIRITTALGSAILGWVYGTEDLSTFASEMQPDGSLGSQILGTPTALYRGWINISPI